MSATCVPQRALECTIIRGGTSKGLYVRGEALPAERTERDRWILALFGSPDPRQIDGLGGADPLTSKLALVSRSRREGIDVEYESIQVGIAAPTVDAGVMCGNLASGVGAFALQEGLVSPGDGVTYVRIYCRNNGKIVGAAIPTENGEPVVAGDCRIDGVPGCGAPIALSFEDPAGGITGKLLPLGEPRSCVMLSDGTALPYSLVDAAALYAFVPASALGLAGDEAPALLDADSQMRARVEEARALIAATVSRTLPDDRAVPPRGLKVAVVADRDGSDRTGVPSTGEDRSITARILNPEKAHKAFAVGGAVCLAAASVVSGTVPFAAVGSASSPTCLTIHHPSGSMPVRVQHRSGPTGVEIEHADVTRTARVMMRGTAYLNV